MAVDHFVAYSSVTKGVGVAAGAPYGCAILEDAETNCGKYSLRVWNGAVKKFWAYTDQKAQKGVIDPTSNMKGSPVYLYAGTQDTQVAMPVMKSTETYFGHYGVDLQTKFDIGSGHAWVIDQQQWGNQCSFYGFPYINYCNFDLAGNMLRHLGVVKQTKVTWSKEHVYRVDQSKYKPTGVSNINSISMATGAFVYVPAVCRRSPGSCGIHVVYHGCGQSESYLQKKYVHESGYNGYAEANDLIVLYPQSINNQKLQNAGCWDWLGTYGAGPKFDEQGGPQLVTVTNMLKDIQNIATGGSPASQDDDESVR